ncbi:pyridoxal-phosphate dependent enzyme [Paraburkholderia sp. UCT2]|nr:pyridoxal-phosphate dependent enzyme [Paraburkholderia sp. UCT2]
MPRCACMSQKRPEKQDHRPPRVGRASRCDQFRRLLVDPVCGESPAGEDGTLVHPCSGRAVIVGNATIGKEIVEDLPDVDVILVPFGGGGLVTGVALACSLWGSHALVYAVRAGSCGTAAFCLGGRWPGRGAGRQEFFRREHLGLDCTAIKLAIPQRDGGRCCRVVARSNG